MIPKGVIRHVKATSINDETGNWTVVLACGHVLEIAAGHFSDKVCGHYCPRCEYLRDLYKELPTIPGPGAA